MKSRLRRKLDLDILEYYDLARRLGFHKKQPVKITMTWDEELLKFLEELEYLKRAT